MINKKIATTIILSTLMSMQAYNALADDPTLSLSDATYTDVGENFTGSGASLFGSTTTTACPSDPTTTINHYVYSDFAPDPTYDALTDKCLQAAEAQPSGYSYISAADARQPLNRSNIPKLQNVHVKNSVLSDGAESSGMQTNSLSYPSLGLTRVAYYNVSPTAISTPKPTVTSQQRFLNVTPQATSTQFLIRSKYKGVAKFPQREHFSYYTYQPSFNHLAPAPSLGGITRTKAHNLHEATCTTDTCEPVKCEIDVLNYHPEESAGVGVQSVYHFFDGVNSSSGGNAGLVMEYKGDNKGKILNMGSNPGTTSDELNTPVYPNPACTSTSTDPSCIVTPADAYSRAQPWVKKLISTSTAGAQASDYGDNNVYLAHYHSYDAETWNKNNPADQKPEYYYCGITRSVNGQTYQVAYSPMTKASPASKTCKK